MVNDIKIHVNKKGDKFYHLLSEFGLFYDNYQHVKGILHRLDGPAIEFASGSKRWFINGQSHREDGPAFEHPSGRKAWFINGKQLSYEEWFEWVMRYSSKDNQMEVILNINK